MTRYAEIGADDPVQEENSFSENEADVLEEPQTTKSQIRMRPIDDENEFDFEVAPMPSAVLRSPAHGDIDDTLDLVQTPDLTAIEADAASPTRSFKHLGAYVSSPERHQEISEETAYLSPMQAASGSPKRMVRSESEIQYFDENAQHLPSELANIVEYNEDDIHHPVPTSGRPDIYELDPGQFFPEDDPVNDPSDEEIDPDTVLDDTSRATAGFGNIIQPTRVEYQAAEEPDEDISAMYPDAVFYPAPVPAQLRLPPLLSRRTNKAAVWRRKRSSRVFDGMMSDSQSMWGISPLTAELSAVRISESGELHNPDNSAEMYAAEDDLESVIPDSDSERATILSDSNSYQDLGDFYRDGNNKNAKTTKFKKKSKFWVQKSWQNFTHKSGEPMEPGDDGDDGIGELDEIYQPKDENDLAFTRFDKHVIDQHTKLFQSGGVYGNIRAAADGNPPSLIEEIEIRRAGRKIQHQVMLKESDMLEQSRHGFAVHPVDQVHQPSLLELQLLADHDYSNRKEWHMQASKKVANRAHPDETLQQRRLRLKNERANGSNSREPPQESLAARKARLRRGRQAMSNTISQTSIPDNASMVPGPENTPALENENFDMVRAVALHM